MFKEGQPRLLVESVQGVEQVAAGSMDTIRFEVKAGVCRSLQVMNRDNQSHLKMLWIAKITLIHCNIRIRLPFVLDLFILRPCIQT